MRLNARRITSGRDDLVTADDSQRAASGVNYPYTENFLSPRGRERGAEPLIRRDACSPLRHKHHARA
jgi:hypothetical protein